MLHLSSNPEEQVVNQLLLQKIRLAVPSPKIRQLEARRVRRHLCQHCFCTALQKPCIVALRRPDRGSEQRVLIHRLKKGFTDSKTMT